MIMRKNFGAKPLSYPQPVFIIATYGEDGTPDAMNAAWGGISEMNEISMCLSAGHKTVKNILKRRAFTVSMADADHVVACDYVGIVSGNKVTDKFAKAGFHATKSDFVDAPLIDELAVAIECKLKDYDPDTCILRGEIVNVSVDERVLDENGKVTDKPLYFFLERYMQSFTDEMTEFIDCVLHDKPTKTTVEDGLQALRMGLAAKKSLAEHRPVKLSEIEA